MAGQERRKMILSTNGANSGTTTTVGNSKGLMQVEMTNINSDFSRTGETHTCIQVSSIHIHLATMLVNKVTNFFYCRFEHAECRWIRDHDSCKIFAMLAQFRFKVIHVEKAEVGAKNWDNSHAADDRRCGVCSVGRSWNKADLSLVVATALMVLSNSSKTSEFTVGTGVRLERYGIIVANRL